MSSKKMIDLGEVNGIVLATQIFLVLLISAPGTS